MDPDGSTLLLQLLFLFVLILVNAFFAASEVALISLKPASIRKLAETGRRGRRLAELTANSGRFLATVQVGVTFAGFMASAFAAESFSDPVTGFLHTHGLGFLPLGTLDPIVVVGITIVLSYVSLVFGELVPKQLGLKYAEGMALHVAGVIDFFARIAAPFVWLLNASVNAVLKLFGIVPGGHHDVTEEEIRMMVDIGEENGAIESDERQLIENVFEFSNTTAGEVMTHRTDVVAINIDAAPEEIENILMGCGFSRVPVFRGTVDDIIGMLHFRDYFTAKINGTAAPDIRELLSPVYLAPETMRANVLFRNMQSQQFGMAVILDEFGGTSGIVTIEDLLEEIVGSLYDEFDNPDDEESVQTLNQNQWLIDGSMRLDDLAKLLEIDGLDREDDEFDTVGGLIFSRLDAVPAVGDRVEMPEFGLLFEVETVRERRAGKIKLTCHRPQPEDAELDDL